MGLFLLSNSSTTGQLKEGDDRTVTVSPRLLLFSAYSNSEKLACFVISTICCHACRIFLSGPALRFGGE
jgi:hypothetical protein